MEQYKLISQQHIFIFALQLIEKWQQHQILGNGLCIKHNHKLMQIIEFQHVKPGKGPAFVRTKMKGIEDGRVLIILFQLDTKLKRLELKIDHINTYIKKAQVTTLCILKILSKYLWRDT